MKRAHHARANKRGASALIAGSAAAKQSETTELAYSEPRTVDEPLTWPTRVRKRPMTPRSVAHAGSESGCEQFWRVCSRLDEDQHRQPRHEPIQRHYFESKVPAPPAGSSWLITSTELSLYDSLVWGDQRCRGGDFGTGARRFATVMWLSDASGSGRYASLTVYLLMRPVELFCDRSLSYACSNHSRSFIKIPGGRRHGHLADQIVDRGPAR